MSVTGLGPSSITKVSPNAPGAALPGAGQTPGMPAALAPFAGISGFDPNTGLTQPPCMPAPSDSSSSGGFGDMLKGLLMGAAQSLIGMLPSVIGGLLQKLMQPQQQPQQPQQPSGSDQ